MFVYLFYNKTFNIHLESSNKNKDEDCLRFLFFNGYENKEEINLINKKDFYISVDNRINELKEKLCEIIFKYIEKFIGVNIYAMQYVIFILLKRIYFCHYKKYNIQVLSFLADSLVNMCFFKESILELIFSFINKKIKSSKNEDLELKNKIIENVNKAKNKKNFLYKFPKSLKIRKEKDKIELEEKEESEDNEEKDWEDNEENGIDDEMGLSKEKNEIIYLYYNHLNIGFLNKEIIYAGKKFVFYEEITQAYSVLEFSICLDDLDITLKISDLTEERVIFYKEKIINVIESPLKIIMFFTNPRILKFEFDNSYSWFRSKSIKYKTNIFYPKNPYSFVQQLLKCNYQKLILQCKKQIFLDKKKEKNNSNKELVDIGDKLLIFKIDGENKVLNCLNLKQNLEAINKMVKDKYLSIFSIFLKIKVNQTNENNEEKSYFYYYKENGGLIENELTKEIFEKYLYDLLLNSKGNINIINLYIINDDSNLDIHYNHYSIKELLGFEPEIIIEGNIQKALFYIQNLSKTQILYYLYKKAYNQEQIDSLLLINFTKIGGFKIILFNKEEIISDFNNFKGLNKNISNDENIKIISEGIKKIEYFKEKKFNIILSISMDDQEHDIIQEKLEKKLIEALGNDENFKENNIFVIKTDLQFNNDLLIESHIFYLDS